MSAINEAPAVGQHGKGSSISSEHKLDLSIHEPAAQALGSIFANDLVDRMAAGMSVPGELMAALQILAGPALVGFARTLVKRLEAGHVR